MSFKLVDIVSSPQDVRALIMEIQSYMQWYGQNTVKAKMGSGVSSEVLQLSAPASQVIEALTERDALNQQGLDAVVQELEQYEKTAPVITLTLAGAPGNKLKKSLVTWCRANISPTILVEFKFNATILGGMVMQFGSHVYDESFRRKILANRAKFPEVLRNV